MPEKKHLILRKGPRSRLLYTRTGTAARGADPGFTLIELVIVIVILGVVLGMVLPRFASVGDARLKADARKVSTLVRYLNEAAETRKRYYRADFDLEKERIEVFTSDDGTEYSPPGDPAMRGLALGVDITDLILPQIGRVTAGQATVVFTPNGSTEPFTLHLGVDGAEGAVSLFFNPYSGKVVVKEGYVRES